MVDTGLNLTCLDRSAAWDKVEPWLPDLALNPPNVKAVPHTTLDHPDLVFAVDYLDYALGEQDTENPPDPVCFLLSVFVSVLPDAVLVPKVF